MATKQISFHLKRDLCAEFEQHLDRIGATKSGVLRRLVQDWIGHHDAAERQKIRKMVATSYTAGTEAA